MDMKIFLQSLNDEEFQKLWNEIFPEKTKRINGKIMDGKYLRPTISEMELMRQDKFAAIKNYRDRTNVSLVEAKTVLEYAEKYNCAIPSVQN